MESIWIKNGTIWTGTSYLDGDVAIQGDKIHAVGDCSGFTADFVYDAKGALVCPGLVDIHTHLHGVSTPDLGILPEAGCYPFGVTAAVDAGCVTTARAVESFALKTLLFAVTHIKDNKIDLTLTEKVLASHPARLAGLKLYFDQGMCGETSVDVIRQTCDYAHSRGFPAMVHCANPPAPMAELLACLGPGDICTHVYQGIGRTVADDDFAALRDAKNRGVILDAGLAGGVHCSFAILEEALRRGLGPDTVSTDITLLSAFIRGGRYGMTMAMSMMRQMGMAEDALLKSVTSSAAAAVGMQSAWGALLPGRTADLAVLQYGDIPYRIEDRNGNVLTADKGYYCLLTVADGKVVYRSDRR